MWHVEFKVPGSDRWESAYGSYSTETEAREAMRANKRELRAEGNPVGKFRVKEGRATARHPIRLGGLVQWGFIGLILWTVFSD